MTYLSDLDGFLYRPQVSSVTVGGNPGPEFYIPVNVGADLELFYVLVLV